MEHPIFSLCEAGELAKVEALVRKEPGCVNARDKFQFTPLLAVASTDSVDVARCLLENGADISAKNDVGATALHIANYPEMTEFFIASGADINAADNEGNTPLHACAADQDGLDSMEALLNAGAASNTWNKAGETALSIATDREEEDKIELLKKFADQ